MSSKRASNGDHSLSKRTEDVPVILATPSTIGGIGVPSGTSKSPWGSTFLDRKNFFENAKKKEESVSGESDEIPKLTRSPSQHSNRRSVRSTSSAHSSPRRVVSPSVPPVTPTTAASTTTSTSVTKNNVMTGQEESVSEGFVPVEPDHGERNSVLLPEPEQRTNKSDASKKKDLNQDKEDHYTSSPVENQRSDSAQQASLEPAVSPKLKTQLLDGRNVHKDKESNDYTETTPTVDIKPVLAKPTPPSDTDNDILTLLVEEKKRLDARLAEVMDENQSFQSEMAAQQKNISALQAISSETKKQKESLHSENVKVSKALGATEKQRDSLLLLEQELRGKVEILERKIAKVEGFYHTSEERKQSLKEELEQLKKEHDKLRDEKTELSQELVEEQISKQNCVKTAKKSQDKVVVLEKELQVVHREKETAVKDRDRHQRLAMDAQKKSSEKEKKVNKMEKEFGELRNVNEKLRKENALLTQQMEQSQSSSHQLKQQIDELKWEKEQTEQRTSVTRQNENDLRTILDQVQTEMDEFGRKVKGFVPEVETGVSRSKGNRPLSVSPDSSAQLKKMKGVNAVVLSGLSTLSNQRKTLDKKVSQLETQVATKGGLIKQLEKKLQESRRELEACQKKMEKKNKELVVSFDSKLQASKEEIGNLTKDQLSLTTENSRLQSELDSLRHSSTQQIDGLQTTLANTKTQLLSDYQEHIGRLLVKRVIVAAQLQLANKIEEVTEEEKVSYSQLLIERKRISSDLDQLQKEHTSALASVKSQQVVIEDQKLETEKIKIRLTTEMNLMKTQIAQLEKEKNELKTKTSGSAFQPVAPLGGPPTRKFMFDPAQEKLQKEVLELRQKLTLMEAENKRLLDLTYTSSTMDAGNVLRKHTLEMRKRCIFLDSEKKQLTDKVHTLHTSMKALRESKDRMISERLRALQNENISLQDNIRTSETMFNKKLMTAASRIAETLKENDKLRCTLDNLQGGLGTMDSLLVGLNQLSADIQRQEQELATLRATLAGSGSNLIPAMEISKRILNTHSEIQSIFTMSRTSEEASPSQPVGRTVSSSGTLPPVLKQFSSEYISSIGGNNDKIPAGRSRSHSHSQSMATPLPIYVLQLREKMSQLHADNLSISDLVKHGQESLEARQNDVSRLRDKLLSLLSNISISVKTIQESRDQLLALNQQTLPQMTSIEFLEHEVENWQDKVFACEIALKDIETRMQEDYESHNQRFSQLMSQILDLKEENSSKRDKLLANEQYINDIEERCMNAENELFKLRKEMESVMQEALKVPEGFQRLSNHEGHVSELIRSQNEDLAKLKLLLNSSTYHQSRLQAKLESIHRENTILKHQGLETDRHHTKILEELYIERDYLKKMNSQLIERQLKPEEAGDMLKKIKRSQEAEKESRDFKKLSAELNNVKFAIREKDIAITELQHQLEGQQLEMLKLLQTQSLSATDTMLGSVHQTKTVHHPATTGGSRSMRPLSADLARQSRYLITNPDHPRVVNRNPVESARGDFLIRIPASNTGDSILNLNESGTKPSDGGYILGFPVVTDDEGANFTGETNVMPSKQTKGRIRRHRRTASEGSDSLKSLMSSESSASDSKPTRPLNQSSTLPRQLLAHQKDVERPESVDSMYYESYSPINTPTPAENNPQVKGDVVGHYAQKFSKQIGEMIHQHDTVDEAKPTKLESSVPVKVERSSGGGKGERISAKIKNFRHVFGSKGNVLEKDKGSSSSRTSDTASSETSTIGSKATPQLLMSMAVDPSKFDETSSSTGSSNQVSRMTSFASTMGRSNSNASSVSTTYSELGGESSPYSTLSLDSFSITDSVDNLMTLDKTFHRGPFFAPISHQNYTSSSDDESRYGARGNRTLKRTSASYYKDFSMPFFLGHHRMTSSCDSDQLLANMTIKSDGRSGIKIPIHRDESISISDMDKELTDQEDVRDRVHRLEKKFGKERRSSTGSVTILCNNSGSSMEDIKNAGD